jgi:hypothetical protein
MLELRLAQVEANPRLGTPARGIRDLLADLRAGKTPD